MQRMNENTQICYAILRGKSNRQLFEEEIQKMKILDVAVNIHRRMEMEVLAYCVLDNELHLLLHLHQGQSADAYLEEIKRAYEENCLADDGRLLRVDYLKEKNHFPAVNSSVQEQGVLYGVKRRASCFCKPTLRYLRHEGYAVGYCVKLHLLPVKRGIVKAPEDYWWCSYLDYLGRKWLPLVSTEELLQRFGAYPKQAVQAMRRRHQQELVKYSCL